MSAGAPKAAAPDGGETAAGALTGAAAASGVIRQKLQK
jgi:hypothetical protein